MDNTKEEKNKNPKKTKKPLTANDILKVEIAKELGLMDKIEETGWKSLTSKESGRIGGILSKRNKEKRNNQDNDS